MACRPVAQFVFLLGILPPLTASAHTTLQGEVTVTGGWTDSVGNAPVDTTSGVLGPAGDFYGEIRPALILTYGSPRFVQRLAYLFTGTEYIHNLGTYANRLEWGGVAEPTRTTVFQFGLFAAEGTLNTLLTGQDASLAQIGAVPIGNSPYFTAGANESFLWELDPVWRLTQDSLFTLFEPFEPTGPLNYLFDPGIRLDRVWQHDSLGGELRSEYIYYQALFDANGAVITPEQRQILSRAMLRWKHDFGHFFGTELGFGVIEMMRASDGGGRIWGPAALAALRYVHPYGYAELTYTYGIDPNTLSGQSYEAHQVSLRASLPFGPKRRFQVGASAGYQHGRLIDVNLGTTTSSLDLVLADASLTYTPRDEISFFVRYQLFYEVGNPSDAAPEPTYGRNTVMIGISGRYPGAPAAVVPGGGPQRVDEVGLSGIPAPHSEPDQAQ